MDGTEQHDTSGDPRPPAVAGTRVARASPQPFLEPPGFSVFAALEGGWEALKARYGLLLGGTLLYFLIVIAAGVIGTISSLFTMLPLANWAGQFLFYPLMWIGLAFIGIRVVRGEDAEIGDLFAGFRRYWPVVGTHALVLLIMYAIVVVGMVIIGVTVAGIGVSGGFGGSSAGPGVAILIVSIAIGVIFVPLVVLLPRIWFAPLVCLDTAQRRLGVIDSFKRTWRMTGRPGVWVGLIALWVVMALVSIVSLMALILPFFFLAVPLGVAVNAAAYWQVSRGYWRSLDHQCRVCSYDLRGARFEVCPECGAPIPPEVLGLL